MKIGPNKYPIDIPKDSPSSINLGSTVYKSKIASPNVISRLLTFISDHIIGNNNAKQKIKENALPIADVSKKFNSKEFIGYTLSPEKAEKYKRSFTFNHLGQIIKTQDSAARLSQTELKEIHSNFIQNLTTSNSTSPREAARTNRELVLELLNLIDAEKNKNPGLDVEDKKKLTEIANTLKLHWLGPEIGSTETEKLFQKISKDLSNGFPELSKKANILAMEAKEKKHFTQQHDNFFGRKFESEFVFHLIKNPTESILNAADKIGEHIQNQIFAIENPVTARAQLEKLSLALKSDPRPWHAEVPELQLFIENPSINNFKKMMENKKRSGYEVIKQSFIAVKFSLVTDVRWMSEANKNYSQVIKPARSTLPSPLGNFPQITPNQGSNPNNQEKEKTKVVGQLKAIIPVTSGFGTQLPHQLQNKGNANWKAEKNIQATVHVNIDAPTKFEENALLNEQNTVNGASGSTNIMTFLFKDILAQKKESAFAEFNIDDAFAGTMMFLTFDGGHSLPESFGTFTSIVMNDPLLKKNRSNSSNDDNLFEARMQTLGKFNLDYRDIPKVFQSSDTVSATKSAIEAAFEQVTNLFNTVHQQRMSTKEISN
jgi:RTX toxin RtxA